MPPPPPAASSGGGGGTSFSIGEPLSYAWKRFTATPVPWILLMLVVFLGQVVIGAIFFFALFGVGNSFFLTLFVDALFVIVYLFLFYALQYGLIRAALGATQGQAPDFAQAWKMDEFVNYAITALLVAAIIGVGSFFCWIPGVIAAFFLYLAPFYAADRKLAPMDAIKASFETTKDNVGSLLIAALVIYLVLLAGWVVCCVGLLVSGPVAAISVAWVYKRVTGQYIAPIEPTPPPAATA